ncbi:MAG TPA: helix-turn-helix transcriptional regulator [Pyrinomonadaceae bacterium]
MEFGSRLRQLRVGKFNQRELAEKVGIDFTYLSKIENGKMPPPSEEVIIKLANELGADADELLQLASKVPEDIKTVIHKSPGMPAFLRSISDLDDAEMKKLEEYARRMKAKREE